MQKTIVSKADITLVNQSGQQFITYSGKLYKPREYTFDFRRATPEEMEWIRRCLTANEWVD